jgi:membrane-associated phospholipid phosphatase
MPLAAITFINGWLGFSFVWLLILVCWSRLKLRVHTPAQVLAGVVVGFVFTYLQMSFITGILSNVIKK